MIYWFLLVVIVVIYVVDMVEFFYKNVIGWYDFYYVIFISVIYLYVFVYFSYCVVLVILRCNKMFKEFNLILNDEWDIGYLFYSCM